MRILRLFMTGMVALWLGIAPRSAVARSGISRHLPGLLDNYMRGPFCTEGKHPGICATFAADPWGFKTYVWKLGNREKVLNRFCTKPQHKAVCDAFDADPDGHKELSKWLKDMTP